MSGMPRDRPPYLTREITRYGKTLWYVRMTRGGPRTRLRSLYGSPEFWQEYQAAIAGNAPASISRSPTGTVAWIIDRYRDSAIWAAFSPATRKQRDAIFRQIIATAGREPLARMTRAAVVAGRDRRKHTPAQARHYLDALRGLCQWAVEAGLLPADPTDGVRPPSQKRSAGFPVWTADEVAAFEHRWPIGTRERVAFDVLRFTGLRRGDAAIFGRQHVRDGIITFRTAKTGETVTIAEQPELATTIAAGPCGDLAFITGPAGQPLTKESFGNWFRDVCRAAGVSKSAHGLRKWFATMLADRGATVSELQAACGWTSGRMALHYTQAADRKRLGLSGTRRLIGNTN